MQSLFIEEKIETTEAKAKAIKGLVDKIINQAKSPTSKTLVTQFIQNDKAYTKLVNELLPRLNSRTSGYTSVVRVGRRLGDSAPVVQMSLLVEEKVASIKEKSTPKKETAESSEKKDVMEVAVPVVKAKQRKEKEEKTVASKKKTSK